MGVCLDMDLYEIREYLQQYNDPNGRLELLLVQKYRGRYFANRPDITNPVQRGIVNLLTTQIGNFIDNEDLEAVPFNPSGQLRDQYSTCNYDYVGNFREVINLFNNPQNELLEPEDINFMIIKLRVNQELEEPKYVYFFKKHHKLRKIRNGFWMRLVDDTFDVMDNVSLIPFDGDIDVIAYEGELAFFSHVMAERIFDIRDQFIRYAQTVLERVQNSNRVLNFDEFYEDCLQDGNIIKRLSKINSNPEIIDLFHENFDNAPEVVEVFDLNIEFNENQTQINYNDRNQLKDITMLMKDAYYRTLLADRPGRDDYNIIN